MLHLAHILRRAPLVIIVLSLTFGYPQHSVVAANLPLFSLDSQYYLKQGVLTLLQYKPAQSVQVAQSLPPCRNGPPFSSTLANNNNRIPHTQAVSPLYLPLVAQALPLERFKRRSGIHLGVRPNNDWLDPFNTDAECDLLFRLRGRSGGIWPAAIVVLTPQVYNIERVGPNCRVSGATVSPGRMFVFNYLREAASRGTKIVFRITPSPGNFAEAVDPDYSKQANRTLLSGAGEIPGGGNYCNGEWQRYRAIDDIAEEMRAIYEVNVSAPQSLPPESFAFVPANEPNNEWYGDDTVPRVSETGSWIAMNNYFAEIYRYIRRTYPAYSNLLVLTPPMGPNRYAEIQNFESCEFIDLDPSQTGNQAGYDYMADTYIRESNGFTWHNYWEAGKENWAEGTNPCQGNSHHLFQYFPVTLQTEITASVSERRKDAFITEADLLSPCQSTRSSIKDKDASPPLTAASLRQFIAQERGANYIVAWLLSEDPHEIRATCVGGSGLINYEEIRWHQAYLREGIERSWFSSWWMSSE